jgi:chemotaxis protein CheC
MYNIQDIGGMELDFFRELENIGAAHAATALSMMLSRPITIRVPRAQLCGYSEICDILNGPESVVAGLLVGISEDIRGFILLVLGEEDAKTLSRSLIGDFVGGMSASEVEEFGASALREVANILIGSYITAISEMTGLKIEASVPELVFDMAGAVMNLLAVAYGNFGDQVLFMETEFSDREHSIMGHFFLIPDIESCKILIEKFAV